MHREQIQRTVLFEIVFNQKLLVLMLNEKLGVRLPRLKIDLTQKLVRDQLEKLACAILMVRTWLIVLRRGWHLHDLLVASSCLLD